MIGVPTEASKMLRCRRSEARPSFGPVSLPLGSTGGLDSGQAEAQGAVPGLRRAHVPVNRPRGRRAVVPAPAPDHSVRGPGRPPRIVHGRFLIIALVVPVPAPLRDVPVHVVQAKGVRLFLTDRVRPAVRVCPIPCISTHSPRCRRRRTASCSPPGRRTPTPPRSASDNLARSSRAHAPSQPQARRTASGSLSRSACCKTRPRQARRHTPQDSGPLTHPQPSPCRYHSTRSGSGCRPSPPGTALGHLVNAEIEGFSDPHAVLGVQIARRRGFPSFRHPSGTRRPG